MSLPVPGFKLSNFNIEDLYKVNFEEVTEIEKRSFGRRFQMKNGDLSSESLILRDIFDEIKTIAETAKTNKDLKTLEAVSVLLGRLDTANNNADEKYKEKDIFFYKILTFISRIFSFGSHSERIEELQYSVSEEIHVLDPIKHLADLKTSNRKVKDFELKNLANTFFDNKDYNHFLEAVKEMSTAYRFTIKELVAKTSEFYLDNKDPEKALETINLINELELKNPIIHRVADFYLDGGEIDKAIDTIRFDILNTKDDFINKVANRFYDENEYEKAIETIELVSSKIYLKEKMIDKVVDDYYKTGDYDKALEILPKCLSSNRFWTALKIGNSSYRNDLEMANKAIEFIAKNPDLNTVQRTNFNELVINVAKCYYNKNEFGKAIELLKPIIYPPRNALLEEIADHYYVNGNYEESLTVIEMLTNAEKERKNAFKIKVADAYHDEGQSNMSIEIIQNIPMLRADYRQQLIKKYS